MPTMQLIKVNPVGRSVIKLRGPDQPPVQGPADWDFLCPVCNRVLATGLDERYYSSSELECWCGTYCGFRHHVRKIGSPFSTLHSRPDTTYGASATSAHNPAD